MSKKSIIILLIFIVLVVIAIIRFSSPEDTWLCQNNSWVKHGNPLQSQPTTNCGPDQSPKACTQEAKLCPDGSSVGRSGPKCEFASCSEEYN